MTSRTFLFNKLIRDKMYKSISGKGAQVNLLKINSRGELIDCFKKKLLEEVEEVKDAKSDVELVEELADCAEVINGFLKAIGVSKERFEDVRQRKYNSRGGFNIPFMVDTISVSEAQTDPNYYKFFINYCMSSPAKYPEITKDVKVKKVKEEVF